MITTESKVKMAKTCLALIQDIAARGARSENPEHIGYALQEISQVLLERTGTQERHFEPLSAGEISGLEALKAELDCADCSSQDLAASDTGSRNDFTAYGNSLN
jgi:hypothetical protein